MIKFQATAAKRILIADDDPKIRKHLSFILENANYQVKTVENGRKALDLILEQDKRGQPFDLLLSDIEMPDMSGLELLDELAFYEIPLPVIVITGFGDKELLTELLRKGCRDYLAKPVDAHKVLDRVAFTLVSQEEEEAKRKKEVQKIKEYHQAKFHIEIESYQNNFSKLQEQVNSAVDTYHKLMDLDQNQCHLTVAWKNRPLMDLGGDFADIRNTPTGCDVLIGDVAGHDLSASYHTILMKAFFDENCRTGKDGQSFFQLLNQQLYDKGKNDRMVTALFLRFNLKTMRGELISAAHPSLMHRRKNIPGLRIFSINSGPLGLSEEYEYEARSFNIVQGDQFFLYTDGLAEAEIFNLKTRRKEKLTTDGLSKLIKKHGKAPLEEMVDLVWKDVLTFCDHKPKDDMFFLGLEIPENLTLS